MKAVLTIKAVALASVLGLCACSADRLPPLTVKDFEITGPRPGTMVSAGYMVLTNNTDAPIDVTSASSPQFERVELHETVVENDIARMRPLDRLHIDANSNTVLSRGGKHLMLMRPIGTFESVTIDLHSGDALILSVSTIVSE